MTDLQINDLEEMKLTDLYKLAKQYQIPYYGQFKKKELIFAILRAQAEKSGFFFMQGILDILPDGFGFYGPSITLAVTRIFTFRNPKFAGSICAPAISFLANVVLRKKMNGTMVCFKSTP